MLRSPLGLVQAHAWAEWRLPEVGRDTIHFAGLAGKPLPSDDAGTDSRHRPTFGDGPDRGPRCLPWVLWREYTSRFLSLS